MKSRRARRLRATLLKAGVWAFIVIFVLSVAGGILIIAAH